MIRPIINKTNRTIPNMAPPDKPPGGGDDSDVSGSEIVTFATPLSVVRFF